jgi:uncharacterized protein
MSTNRRDFLTQSAIGLSSFGFIPFLNLNKAKVFPTYDKGKIICRTLGKTGIKLPVVSMGVMNANLPDLIPASYDLGIRHFDTAMGYQSGKNEEMVGSQIKELGVRSEVTISTKIPLPRPTPDQPYGEEKKHEFLKNFEGSLKRLQTDYVDILYIHGVSDVKHLNLTPIKEALTELKESKKVRFIGVSTHKNMSAIINEVVKSKFYDIVLTAINFTMSNDDDLKKAIKYASDSGIGVIAMKTQGGGKWYQDKNPDSFKGKMSATAVLKWALKIDGITTAIPGYTNFDHMKEDFSVASDLEYTDEEKQFLKNKNVLFGAAFCRQCDGCLASCSKGVDIPSLMRTSMYLVQYANLYEARSTFNSIESERNIDNCKNCSSCNAICNNKINISERINDLKTIFA